MCRYDQPSKFRWKALFQLFANAFSTGVLRVPISAIESTWTIRISGEKGDNIAINDETWLVPLFQSLKVKNRRIARDMLVWQEVRQPAGLSYSQWDSKVSLPRLW